MRIFTRKGLRDFSRRYPDIADAIEKFERIVQEAEWGSLQDVRRIYPHADAVTVASGRTATVFNLGGNKYRLVVAIHYNTQRLYVLCLLTHAEYSRDLWKDNL